MEVLAFESLRTYSGLLRPKRFRLFLSFLPRCYTDRIGRSVVFVPAPA